MHDPRALGGGASLEKTFNPREIDARWSKRWFDANAFAIDPSREERYCIMIPPPNITGSLHMGHALNNTIQDILIRYHRMRGIDTLWQPGTDHAGIATQMVVERKFEEEGKTRHDLGRDAFVERVWQWREESGSTILNQLYRLGASADWSRERFTMDEGLSKAVRKVFVDLFKQGLIYKDKRLVNWDTKLHTAISDLEVQSREVKGDLWYIKYPVEGKKGASITVATTRPETMLGDTAVAVHPDDDRYKDLVGKNVMLPLVNRLIPIVADEYSDPEKGSGAVKITPAHDFNDFEVGRRHKLEVINIFDAGAKLNENVPEKYRGLDRFKVRKMVVEDLEDLGLMEKVDDERHMVPYGDRSGVVLEPWLTDQWFVDAPKLAAPAIEAVESGRTEFVPANWAKTYFEWMRNIQPWCISRQIWWGHRVPAWYGPDGAIFVEFSEEEAQAAAEHHYGKAVELTRDTDVLDTWFSSALWPFSTLGWPEETEELARYYPTNVLVTGFDIIFFWVARMMMMGLHFMGEAPFKTVYVHALVRDEKGQKMSKSKGNIMDPLHLVDEYGADALRFTLAAMAAPGRDIKLSENRVQGYRNFATKMWNVARFLLMHDEQTPIEVLDPSYVPTVTSADDQHILSRLNDTILAYRRGMDTYRFNDVAHVVYDFIWHQFCDWYVEYSKPILNGDDQDRRRAVLNIMHHVFSKALRLLHPLMPFITEELWEGMGYAEKEGLLIKAHQPRPLEPAKLQEQGVDSDMVTYVESKHDLIRAGRTLRSDYGLLPKQAAEFIIRPSGPDQHILRLEKDRETVSALLRAGSIRVDSGYEPDGAIPSALTRLGTLYMPIEGMVDIEEEIQKLTAQVEKVRGDLERITKKLSNENFVSKAPRDVVARQEERKGELIEQKQKLGLMIETLSAHVSSE